MEGLIINAGDMSCVNFVLIRLIIKNGFFQILQLIHIVMVFKIDFSIGKIYYLKCFLGELVKNFFKYSEPLHSL